MTNVVHLPVSPGVGHEEVRVGNPHVIVGSPTEGVGGPAVHIGWWINPKPVLSQYFNDPVDASVGISTMSDVNKR